MTKRELMAGGRYVYRRWYAVPNDLIGGWAVATDDVPPSEHSRENGIVAVADCMDEPTARHIAALHNEALAEAGLTLGLTLQRGLPDWQEPS